MITEQEAYARIAQILAQLERDVAARVARRLVDSFAGPSLVPGGERIPLDPAAAEGTSPGSGRPSFLRTQHRMDVGKKLLDKLAKRKLDSGAD